MLLRRRASRARAPLKKFRKDASFDSIFLIYKIFRENDKKTFCFSDFFIK